MKNAWILILGANSGMAQATAKCFAEAGFNLYMASRNTAELAKTCQDIHLRYAVEAKALAFDARAFETHEAFYQGLEIKPSGVIVAFGSMHEQVEAEQNFNLSKDMIETNYTGAVSIIEIVCKDLLMKSEGFIVGISSVAGDRGRQSNYIYGSSKAAFSTYLAGLSHRLHASNINVITVKPGFVATKMTAHLDLPEKLTAQPEEVANRIFKASQKNKSATIYVKPVWRLVMLIITHIPNFIFNKTKM